MAKTFKNFIGGKWVAPATGDYFENRNPADTRDLIGRFPDSGAADIERRSGPPNAASSSGRALRRRPAATCSAGSAICWSRGRKQLPTR